MLSLRNMAVAVPMPPHAYVPGRTPRHPEDWFDAIKASVDPDTRLDQLQSTQAFAAGRAYFDAGFFWECHEVLEPVWMRTPDPSPERDMIQAFIQLANARLKHQMGRSRAVFRLCDIVNAHLDRCAGHAVILGVEIAELRALVSDTANMQISADR